MRAARGLLVGTVVLTPALVALTALRPLDAATVEPFSTFGLTVTSAAVRTTGDVGAGGGLASLEAGIGFTSARLDAAPSSHALATPVEPGPVFRSVGGTVNNEAGQQLITVSEAESAYPGPASAASAYADPVEAGPLTLVPGVARSSAGTTAAHGDATGTSLAVEGLADATRLHSVSDVRGEDTAGSAAVSGTSAVGGLVVAGVLVVEDLIGTASVTAQGATTKAAATLTIGSASVAGTPVTIDSEGVHVAGQSGGFGPLQGAQDTVNAALAAAGIDVHAVAVTKTVTGRSGYADTGGLVVHVVTPALDPAGVAGNELTLTLGKVTVTGTSEAAVPLVEEPDVPLPDVPAVPPTTTTTTVVDDPGLVGVPSGTGGPAPQVAPGRTLLLAGHRVSAGAAFAGFAAWQLLSMAITTLYAMTDRRRRAALEVDA